MSEEEYRHFFADCKLSTNISFGKWLDRNGIYRSEFTNFLKGKYHKISNYQLEILKNDILSNLSDFLKLYENIIGEVPYTDIYDTPFTDCNYASEYNNYIAAAYELGITNGTTHTTFSPYKNITREQLTTMLYRVIKLAENDKTYDFDVTGDLSYL